MATFLLEEDKQALLDRYYDIEWCDDVTDLRCVRCHRVAIDPRVSSCQHIFCNNCSQFYGDGKQSNCPQCQDHISQLDDHDFDLEVKIHRLKMFCPNKKYGCKYSGQLRKIPSHLMTCADTREALLLGKSSVDAQLTNLDDTFAKFREKISEMNNKVGEKLNKLETKTDNMARQLNALTEKMTSLEKKIEDNDVGIQVATKSRVEDLPKTSLLLQSPNQKVQNNRSNLQIMPPNMESMVNAEMKTLHYKKSKAVDDLQTTFEWTIEDVKKIVPQINWTVESKVFMFKGYKHEIRAKLEKENGIVRISLQFKDGITTRLLKPNHEFTSVKYIVRDPRSNKTKKDVITEADLRFDECFGRYNWIFRKRLPVEILSKPYVRSDCIKISIILKPQSIDRRFVSNNGVLKWRVDNYKAKKHGWVYYGDCSPTFCTSPQGYMVKTQLLIDDEGLVSLRVIFLTGEHDANLSRDFHHTTTVTLYNRVDPSKSLVKSKQMYEAECYTIPFGISAVVEQNDFIYHNSLLLKVAIEPVTSDLIKH